MKNKIMLAIITTIFVICVSTAWFFGLMNPVENSNMHICTAEEKAAEMCTMEYAPVCGNDGVTYGNKCSACASKINSYVVGECNQVK